MPRVPGYLVFVCKGKNVNKFVKAYNTKGNSLKITGLNSYEYYSIGVIPYKTINGKKLFSDDYYHYYAQIR